MTEAESKFEEYREFLRQELIRLSSYIRLYKRLHERKEDRLSEMDIAPGFFQVTIDSLFTGIILWTDNLLGERSERSLVNFLIFIEYNLKILSIEKLKSRKNYPDDHWMLDREKITLDTINEHRKAIKELAALKSIKHRRDKFHAHFDKDYFFDREKLQKEAPLEWEDLELIINVSKDIINTYSSSYDGNLYEIVPLNSSDVDIVLDIMYRHKNKGNS